MEDTENIGFVCSNLRGVKANGKTIYRRDAEDAEETGSSDRLGLAEKQIPPCDRDEIFTYPSNHSTGFLGDAFSEWVGAAAHLDCYPFYFGHFFYGPAASFPATA